MLAARVEPKNAMEELNDLERELGKPIIAFFAIERV
jgi:hypothetical protein